MDQDGQPESKKRTVYAPQLECDPKPRAVISVELDGDEDVEWTWTHTSDGKSVVTGYTITKKPGKPRQQPQGSTSQQRGGTRQRRRL